MQFKMIYFISDLRMTLIFLGRTHSTPATRISTLNSREMEEEECYFCLA